MMETTHKKHGNIAGIIAAYFLIYVVWGSTYFFIGMALSDFPPFLLGALRFMAAGLILLTLCYRRGEKIFRKRLIGRSAVTGIVLLFVDMAVVMLAQRYVTSSFVAIIASSTASTASWLSLAYLILFGSLLAYSAYVWLLKVRPAAEVGTHAYVNPFIAVLLGVFLGNEEVTVIQMSGLLVILLGVVLIGRRGKKRAPQSNHSAFTVQTDYK